LWRASCRCSAASTAAALAVLGLAGAGLLAMYSSGFDHGTRFEDHGRNMLMAAAIMFVVAQVPPQRLMAWRCRCMWAVALLVAVALFGITKQGRARAGSTSASRSSPARS
jgi:rod shape determining protein RodA